jgi:hypothetical protein
VESKEKKMMTDEAVLLNEGDDVQCLEVRQARSELREELAWRRCIDNEDC